nr:unnamed protein product [Callosobruchus analis]
MTPQLLVPNPKNT